MSQQNRLLELCSLAVVRYGANAQIRQCAEECAELGAECLRVHRGRVDHMDAMYEECADVLIMVTQLAVLDPERMERHLEQKMQHLEELLGVRS